MELGAYFHFPYCQRCCAYCDFFKKPLEADANQNFKRYLAKIMAKVPPFLQEQPRKLDSIYFGGGSPSLADAELIKFLADFLHQHFPETDFAAAEITLEVNPEDLPTLAWNAWRDLGVNRVSLGLQSAHPVFRQKLGRRFKQDDWDRFIAQLQRQQLPYSFDLLLGLPFGQRDLAAEIAWILGYQPQHLSAYILTPPPRWPWPAVEEEQVVAEFLQVDEQLTKAQFQHYEISNYALAGQQARHNLKYWHLAPVVAFGPSAVGLVSWQGQWWRYRWPEDFSCDPQVEQLSADALALERLYLAWRLGEGVALADHFPAAKITVIQGSLERYGQDVALVDGRYHLTPRGMLRMDGLVVDLAKHLPHSKS